VSAEGGEVLVAALPWRARIDLGKLIVEVYEQAVNELTAVGVAAAQDSSVHIPHFDSLIQYDKILVASGVDAGQIESADWEELMEVLKAVCEVNSLMNLYYMLNPNTPSPSADQMTMTGEEASDGLKTSSTEDSSAPESPSETLSN